MKRSLRPGALALSAAFLCALFAAAAPASGQPLAQRPQPAAERLEVCLACHGKDGSSQTPLTPSLGGQPSFFVTAQLFLFREGRRGTVMDAFAKGLSDADLTAFSAAIAKLPPPAPPGKAADPARFARGAALVQKGNCASCHNPDFSGREQMPRIANQREDYLLKALKDYRSGARPGYGMAVMGEALHGLGEAQLADLAHFLAHLPRAAPPKK